MSVWQPLTIPTPQNEDTASLTILTPGNQPVIYQWNDNYGTTQTKITPNPNTGEDRIVTSDQ